MRKIICVISIFYLGLCMLSTANAAIVNLSIENPGAEDGLVGWESNNFEVIINSDMAYEGDACFKAIIFERGSLRQSIDLSYYAGNIENIIFQSYTYQNFPKRLGYDEETDQNYIFILMGLISMSYYDVDGNHLGGRGITIYNQDTWYLQQANISSLDNSWDDIKSQVASIEIRLSYTYTPDDYDTGIYAFNIDTWGEWVDDGVTPDIRFDSAELNIEIVPIPSAIWLLGAAIIGMTGLRRKNQMKH